MAKQIAVLISGRGSNLQALSEAASDGRIAGRIVQVISDRAGAAGLDAASRLGVPTHVAAADEFGSHENFEEALMHQLEKIPSDWIALAGFMRILSARFIREFDGKLINIHPSLLPAWKGLDTHRRVLEAGELRHGCSVHFVTEVLDSGPLIAQSEVAVEPGDTPQTLAARVLRHEHRLYPWVMNLCCEDRLQLRDGCCFFDGRILHQPLRPDFQGPANL